MQASVWLYRLYDVAQEINLDKVEQLLAGAKPVTRLRLSRVSPKSMHFKNPPVTIELHETNLHLLDTELPVTVTARVYDLGVVTVLFRINLPPWYGYRELKQLAAHLALTKNLEPIFWNYLQTVRDELRTAFITDRYEGFVEDFTIFYFREWHHEWDPVPLLLGEDSDVSPEVRQETLKYRFSYSQDFAYITWESAVVYDPSGSTDIPDLLEFASAQLLELRYYDYVLEMELQQMYEAIEEADRRHHYPRLSRYRRITRRLLELVAEITEITGRIQNALRVTEDVFYARVYGTALKIFRVKDWADSIGQKVDVIERSYAMLSDEIVTHRFLVLDTAIVLLFIIEIIIGILVW
jgi:hypothetical protein